MTKAGVRFLSFDAIKNHFRDECGRVSGVGGVLAGLGAGLAESTFAVTPSERIKTALIDDAKNQRVLRNGLHAVQVIVRDKGPLGLYQGYLATTLKQTATSAVRMGSYNALREWRKKTTVPQNAATTFATGAVAGVITVYATQPFDTVKSRTQALAGQGPGEALRSVLRDSGVRGLWSGSTMRLGRLLLSGGIVFTVYEHVCGLLSGQMFQYQSRKGM
ncbi:Tricarboxylate transport protein [Cladophialophora carrionii]|uniref:Tricarboxylate transport protein n=1 Tax=Cladophialophora carrionii TaxID=86049 RepID=A0A1C1CTE2_9EURO|nr:Tricarboxylate transport protein [Cladophialophora carrionii]